MGSPRSGPGERILTTPLRPSSAAGRAASREIVTSGSASASRAIRQIFNHPLAPGTRRRLCAGSGWKQSSGPSISSGARRQSSCRNERYFAPEKRAPNRPRPNRSIADRNRGFFALPPLTYDSIRFYFTRIDQSGARSSHYEPGLLSAPLKRDIQSGRINRRRRRRAPAPIKRASLFFLARGERRTPEVCGRRRRVGPVGERGGQPVRLVVVAQRVAGVAERGARGAQVAVLPAPRSPAAHLHEKKRKK